LKESLAYDKSDYNAPKRDTSGNFRHSTKATEGKRASNSTQQDRDMAKKLSQKDLHG